MEFEREYWNSQATKKDVSAIDRIIAEWLNWRAPRAESIKRAIENKELLVTDKNSEVIGFIHCATHEDIIDGGLNSFITCFYIGPEFRNKGMGSQLLERATKDALDKGALGIESSTASPIARRLFERGTISNNSRVIGQWAGSSWNQIWKKTSEVQKRAREQ